MNSKAGGVLFIAYLNSSKTFTSAGLSVYGLHYLRLCNIERASSFSFVWFQNDRIKYHEKQLEIYLFKGMIKTNNNMELRIRKNHKAKRYENDW